MDYFNNVFTTFLGLESCNDSFQILSKKILIRVLRVWNDMRVTLINDIIFIFGRTIPLSNWKALSNKHVPFLRTFKQVFFQYTYTHKQQARCQFYQNAVLAN